MFQFFLQFHRFVVFTADLLQKSFHVATGFEDTRRFRVERQDELLHEFSESLIVDVIQLRRMILVRLTNRQMHRRKEMSRVLATVLLQPLNISTKKNGERSQSMEEKRSEETREPFR